VLAWHHGRLGVLVVERVLGGVRRTTETLHTSENERFEVLMQLCEGRLAQNSSNRGSCWARADVAISSIATSHLGRKHGFGRRRTLGL